MKKVLCCVFVLLGWSAGSRAGVVATHGMLLLGKQVHYASHLPMFHAPHDYQALLKISLKELPGGSALHAYQAAQAKGQTLFTLLPEPFDLTQVAVSMELKADLYQGHFEKDGVKLGSVVIHIDQVTYFHHLDPKGTTATENYLVFGEKGEYFAAHLIVGQPNVDVILQTAQPFRLTAEDGDAPCHARFCPPLKTEKVPDGELPLSLLYFGEAVAKPGETLGGIASPGFAHISDVLYVEKDDLH